MHARSRIADAALSTVLAFSALLFAGPAPAQAAEPPANSQTVSVTGTLQNERRPVAATTVRLYELDTLSPDDLMAASRSAADGTFTMSGSDTEFEPIRAAVRIYTHIEVGGGTGTNRCPRRITLPVPQEYVNSGTVYHLGTINLARIQGNIRECI